MDTDYSKWPVGLKNVGQTCWFSAVIQSLFFLPAFRNLVLNYQAHDQLGEEAEEKQTVFVDEKERKISEFMAELRLLFALMLASERKCVDVVETIRNYSTSAYRTSHNDQEDVSEVTLKLFEMMEHAFKAPKMTTTTTNSSSDSVPFQIKEEKMEECELVQDNRLVQESQEADMQEVDRINNEYTAFDLFLNTL